MKLHWSPRSPQVRKVMIVAHELGLVDRITRVRSVVDPRTPNLVLMEENPLSKIPTLVLDGGTGALRFAGDLRVSRLPAPRARSSFRAAARSVSRRCADRRSATASPNFFCCCAMSATAPIRRRSCSPRSPPSGRPCSGCSTRKPTIWRLRPSRSGKSRSAAPCRISISGSRRRIGAPIIHGLPAGTGNSVCVLRCAQPSWPTTAPDPKLGIQNVAGKCELAHTTLPGRRLTFVPLAGTDKKAGASRFS